MVIWLFSFQLGQVPFQRVAGAEASKLSSLLGLKILVLAFIWVTVMGGHLGFWRWFAVILSATAAVGMNYSGGNRYTLRGLGFLLLALTAYSLADISETRLVLMPTDGGIIWNSIRTGVGCYAVLGVRRCFCANTLDAKLFRDARVCAEWFFSQVALFRLSARWYGVRNVIQASGAGVDWWRRTARGGGDGRPA